VELIVEVCDLLLEVWPGGKVPGPRLGDTVDVREEVLVLRSDLVQIDARLVNFLIVLRRSRVLEKVLLVGPYVSVQQLDKIVEVLIFEISIFPPKIVAEDDE